MSFLDRLKSLFGGEGRGDDRVGASEDAPRTGETNLDASLGTPPVTPVDPLGTPTPEATQQPPTPPPERDEA